MPAPPPPSPRARPGRSPPSSAACATASGPPPGCGGSSRCRPPRGHAARAAAPAAERRRGRARGRSRSGRQKRKREPRPGSLSTAMRPPISPTSWAEIERPRPVPPYSRVVEPSAWAKASKISSCLSRGMPIPVSATRKPSTTAPASSDCFSTCTTTSPRSVNLMALPTRLTRTWRSRGPSPTRRSGTSGAIRPASSRPFWCARRPSVRRVSPRVSRRSNSAGFEVEPPRLDLREVEHVVDEPEERLRRVLEGEQVLPLLGGEGRVEQQLGHPDDGVHRGPDLVAHVGEEVALGPAGRDRGLPRELQLLRDPPLLGDVARHRVDEALLRQGGGLPREPAVGAVLAQVAVLEEDGARAARDHPRLGRRGAAVVRVDELDVGPRHQLGRREAERLLPGRVQPPEACRRRRRCTACRRGLEERRELRLRTLSLHELADLAPDGGQHLEELRVGTPDLPAEELEHPDHLGPEEEREAEGGVKARPGDDGPAGEVGVVDHVRGEEGLGGWPRPAPAGRSPGRSSIPGSPPRTRGRRPRERSRSPRSAGHRGRRRPARGRRSPIPGPRRSPGGSPGRPPGATTTRRVRARRRTARAAGEPPRSRAAVSCGVEPCDGYASTRRAARWRAPGLYSNRELPGLPCVRRGRGGPAAAGRDEGRRVVPGRRRRARALVGHQLQGRSGGHGPREDPEALPAQRRDRRGGDRRVVGGRAVPSRRCRARERHGPRREPRRRLRRSSCGCPATGSSPSPPASRCASR